MAFSDLHGEASGVITAGQRGFSAIAAGRQVPQFIDELIRVNANVAPLFAMMKTIGLKKTVKGPVFFHLETDDLPIAVEIDNGGGYAAGVTTLTLAATHSGRVVIGDLILVPRTDEVMRVTSISGADIIVTRGFGGATAAALNDDEEMKLIGTAAADGAGAQGGISSEPAIIQNAVQIYRQVVELTGRDIEAAVYGEKETLRTLNDAQRAIMLKIEQNLLFGTAISLVDPTASGGLKKFITTNITLVGGVALDEATWNTHILNTHRRNQGMEMFTLVGENISTALDTFGRDALDYRPDDRIFGVDVAAYKNSHGRVTISKHGLLSDTLGSQSTMGRWGGFAFSVNPKKIGRAVFANRGMGLEANIETPGTDGKKWEYMSDEGLYLLAENNHSILSGAA